MGIRFLPDMSTLILRAYGSQDLPAALRTWVYISGRILVPMLQLLNYSMQCHVLGGNNAFLIAIYEHKYR